MLSRLTRQLRLANRSLTRLSMNAAFSSETKSPVNMDQTNSRVENSVNTVTLLGRVGTKPRQIDSESGSFVSFSLATNSYIGPGGMKTEWHDINVNRDSLQKYLIRNVDVGDRLYLTGKLSYSKNNRGRNVNIRSDNIQMITRSPKNIARQQELEEDEDEF